MYRSKKEVDRYVIDLDRSLKNEVERGLKSLTVAKLYYNVGDYQSALNSLDKYDLCRKNSAQSLRLRGQVSMFLKLKML
jgi:Tfp pilus assembly protein PilF